MFSGTVLAEKHSPVIFRPVYRSKYDFIIILLSIIIKFLIVDDYSQGKPLIDSMYMFLVCQF